MEPKTSHIAIAVALCRDTRAIGFDGDLPWPKISKDMRRFVQLTSGHPVIMGSKTWESIPAKYRPLDSGRTSIVISRNPSYEAPGAIVVHSLEEALDIARESSGSDEIFVAGGGKVYAEALPQVDVLYITEVAEVLKGDTYFPEYENEFTKVVEREEHPENDPPLTFLTLRRNVEAN